MFQAQVTHLPKNVHGEWHVSVIFDKPAGGGNHGINSHHGFVGAYPTREAAVEAADFVMDQGIDPRIVFAEPSQRPQ